jgi:hypothetical protein
MRLSSSIVAALFVLVSLTAASPVYASTCAESGQAVGDYLAVEVECSQEAGVMSPQAQAAANGESSYAEYKWVSACSAADAAGDGSVVTDCAAARACPDPVERLWRLWGRLDGEQRQGWEPLYTQCFGRPPTTTDAPRPTVTPGRVLTALRQIGLPALEARTQPAGKTLVNFETIFYAEPQAFTRTITLLGQRVDVEASPATYTWHHGDGTSASTETPGARYPAKDVVHEYSDAHTTVSPSVDVTYTARFRVNGGAWQDIAETVTITGPGGSLRIAEATAVLSGSYR